MRPNQVESDGTVVLSWELSNSLDELLSTASDVPVNSIVDAPTDELELEQRL